MQQKYCNLAVKRQNNFQSLMQYSSTHIINYYLLYKLDQKPQKLEGLT